MKEYTAAGSGISFPTPNATWAQNLRRFSPSSILTWDDVGTRSVQPFATPWTLTDDDYGIPFTSGRIGVGLNIGSLGGGDFDAQTDAFIAENTVPVPAILPGGYTARLEHDCDGFLGVDMGNALDLTRYMDANGPVSNLWVPYSAAQARGYQTVIFPAGFTLIDWESVSTPVIGWLKGTLETGARGWRNITLLWQCIFVSSAPPHNITGAVDFYISHNADGSTVAAGDHFGDTIDFSCSLAKEDFSYVNDFGSFGHYECPPIEVGALNPTFGVPTNYRLTLRVSETTGTLDGTVYAAGIGTVTLVGHMSPTDDIPFRWTCCGDDDLVAPGGLV